MNEPRDPHLSAAFMEKPCVLAGHTMRQMSLATFDVLLRTKNPLVLGDSPNEGTPEFTAAIIGFAYIHCAPWPDVVEASFDPSTFHRKGLLFCGDMTPEDFERAMQSLSHQGDQLRAAQVTPVAEAGKKSSPPTSPA